MIDFLKVEETVRSLKNKVEAGELDQAAFEETLKTMIDVADDGYYWMFGHKSGQWYRHNGHSWVPDSPGELLLAARQNRAGHSSAPEPDWANVDLGWFSLALTLVVVLFIIVYVSAA